jgi:hypothetical protein
VTKPYRLGFEPLTNAEYVELLYIGNLSDPDKEVLRNRARAYELPPALSESENVQRAIFGGLYDSARILSAKQIVPLTSDEQAGGEQRTVAWFNCQFKQAGWDVRLEQYGPVLPDVLYCTAQTFSGQPVYPAPSDALYRLERWRELALKPPPQITLRLHHEFAKTNGVLVPARQGPIVSKAVADGWGLEYRRVGGVRFIVGDASTIRLKRGTRLSDAFVFLWLTGEGEPVHPAMFGAQADRHWEKRLRHRVVSNRLGDPADLACRDAERRRKQTRDSIDGIAAVWSSALDRQGIEGVIPTNWPMRWAESGPIPTAKPHEADKCEIITDPKTGKRVALFAIDNSRGALTSFPIHWRVGIGPNTRSVDKPDLEERKVALSSAVRSIEAAPLETHYLQKRESLPAPRLQQMRRRTGTLYRDTWNDFQLDTRTLPVYRDEVGITEVEEDEIDA